MTATLVQVVGDGVSTTHRATIAMYAGMDVQELQMLVQHALKVPCGWQCTAFLVEKTTKKQANAQLIPLSVACMYPDRLKTMEGPIKTVCVNHTAADTKQTKYVDGSASTVDSNLSTIRCKSMTPIDRIMRLITALRDDRAINSFEAAVLMDLCEEQQADVSNRLRRVQTLDQKKQVLLGLLHGQQQQDANTSSTSKKESSGRADQRNPSISLAKSPATESKSTSSSVMAVYNCLIAIGHTVFSPQVQSDILTEASLYRESKSKQLEQVGRGGNAQANTLLSMEATIAQVLELLTVVERLLNKHALPEEHSIYLIRMILSENRVLLSALQSYKLDQNKQELEATMQRVATLGLIKKETPTAKSKAKKAKTPSPRKKARKERKGFIVRPADILHTLYQKSMLTSLEHDILRALVQQEDGPVLLAVDDYEQHRDLNVLRDTLVGIVEEITTELEANDQNVTQQQPEGVESLMMLSEDGQWQPSLRACVHHWFTQRILTQDQANILYQLIDENHNLLQSAFEVFVADQDENELLDTLQRIAKLQLQAMEGATTQAFNQLVEDHCHVLRTHEKQLIQQLFARRNELVHAAWEVYQVEQNVDELGDTLLRIVRFTSRNDSKLRLVEIVGEMMRRQLIRSHQADGLIQLFEARNDALVAAMEAFESDQDVHELVETLLLVVKHADFGEAPQCTTPSHHSHGNHGKHAQHSVDYAPGTEQYVAARLLKILAQKNRLSRWQMEILMHLLSMQDERLMAVIDVYNGDRQANELIDTLWRLCDLAAWEQHRAQLIQEWIDPLEKSGEVPVGILRELVDKRDDRIIAALVVYMGDGDAHDFNDTLQRIARLASKPSSCKRWSHQSSSPAKSSSKSPTRSPMQSYSRQTSATPSQLERDPDEALDEHEVSLALKAMVNAGDLTMEERTIVQTMVSNADPHVMAVFDLYQASGDIQELADTLQRILRAMSPSKKIQSMTMEKQLLHLVHELSHLSNQEVAALKAAIAQQDAMVEAAIEVYQQDKDEDDLKDTLTRIAKHKVQSQK